MIDANNKWRPISTAPVGLAAERVLVTDGKAVLIAIQDISNDGVDTWFPDNSSTFFEPTHWMPLPETEATP